MAQAYASLGSAVTIVEGEQRLISREEPFAAAELRDAMIELGIDVRLGVRAERVTREAGVANVVLSDGATRRGRRDPRRGRPPAADAGSRPRERRAEARRAPIEVDDRLQVPGMPWLYAIGDANGRALLTHMGKYQAHVLSEILDGGDARATRDNVGAPRVVFTEPQVAAVGMTLAIATEHGLAARAYDVPTSSTAGASFHGRNTPGTSRIVVDETRGVIIGATFSGTDVAEWLHAATIAIVGETPIASLWDAVPAFPTRSEVWLRLLEQRERELARPAG